MRGSEAARSNPDHVRMTSLFSNVIRNLPRKSRPNLSTRAHLGGPNSASISVHMILSSVKIGNTVGNRRYPGM